MAWMDETQQRLVRWSGGQHSERMAASVLDEEGYDDIDPSHPYGGPDGGRDIECTKDGRKWIGAVYFSREQSFAATEKKLIDDLDRARKHDPYGVAFVTNQELKLSERAALVAVGTAVGIKVDLFHMERLATILDRPHMHPVRDQYLSISVPAPPLDLELGIDGAAVFIPDGEVLRDYLIAAQEQSIRDRAEKARATSVEERQRRKMLARTFHQPDPGDPPSEADTDSAVAAVRARMSASWPRSEHWLTVRACDGLRFTVTNRTEAFLRDVEVKITVHGVHGFEKEYDTDRAMKYLRNPDYTPPWQDAAAAVFIQRLANREVQWDNVDDDLCITLSIDALRPPPGSWISRPDEVMVIATPADHPLVVSWHASADGYNSTFHGSSLELPIREVTVRDVVARVFGRGDED